MEATTKKLINEIRRQKLSYTYEKEAIYNILYKSKKINKRKTGPQWPLHGICVMSLL